MINRNGLRYAAAAIAAFALIAGMLRSATAQTVAAPTAAAPTSAPQTSAAQTVVTAQILDYEKGYLFFTSGDGFHVAPSVTILNGQPEPREYARVTFDGSGTITRIELSQENLPAEGDISAVHRFAVALSTPAPNPELAAHVSIDRCSNVRPGKSVSLGITVQVPPTTPLTDTVYMTSDQSGWNAQAYRLDRVDALHYRILLKLLSGTDMHVLFDRGSTQSIQTGQNGLEQTPYLLCIGDEDAQAFRVTVYHWGDEQGNGQLPVPQTFPTPYNPAPFPNLPNPPQPVHTSSPNGEQQILLDARTR